MPASSVVADGTAVVAGLLAGLAREEGACIFAGSVACMCSGIFCCSRMLYNVAGTSCSFIFLSLCYVFGLVAFRFCH